MPPKRRRVSESTEDAEEGSAEVGSLDSTRPRPHDDFWFSDGSVVLATEVHLYRVHKSMLAKYSSVLNDMFEIPSEGANTDCWEGVPIVKMAGDSDEDVFALLKSLYNRSFRDTLEGSGLSVLSSLLSISTKYDFRETRADVVQYLELLFPNSLEKYQTSIRKLHILSPTCFQLFTLAVTAFRCEILSILPTLFYYCTSFSLNVILKYIHILPEDCSDIFLLGRDWIVKVSYSVAMRALQSDNIGGDRRICNKSRCLEQFRAQIKKNTKVERKEQIALILDLPDKGVLEGLDEDERDICEGCAKRYIAYISKAQGNAWTDLPMAFVNKRWDKIIRG